MIYCINFRYFTAPVSKFSKPPCEIFLYKICPLCHFSCHLYRKYKFAKRLCRAQKCPIFYKFRGGILRICGRLAQTRVTSVLLSLVWGAVYLGVSRKFSLNLLDLRSNLKAAYQPLLALPSRWLRRYRALRYTDRVAHAARR